MSDLDTPNYSIGAAARHTGLSVANLRMWEKRYGAVRPHRSDTRRRMFSERDLERLSLLKQLVDLGHPIRTIADLTDEELRKRLTDESVAPPGRQASARGGRVLCVGPGLGAKLRGHRLLGGEVVADYPDLAAAMAAEKLPQIELLVIETDTLFPEVIAQVRELVRRTGARRSLLLYFFSRSQTAAGLVQTVQGLAVLRAPIDPAQLLRECLIRLQDAEPGELAARLEGTQAIPERIFSADQLAQCSAISSTVECECPQHLAGLLQALTAFETYSRECEDRNPDDALLHAFLHRTTAQVRHTMEDALREVLHAEGIQVA